MKSRIIIVGAGGSGKDHLKQRFINRGYQPSISYTTRPPRNGEKEGIDYHFITNSEFHEMIRNGEFYEFKEFNGWFYGVRNLDFDTKDLFIMTPPAIEEMDIDIRNSSFIIYLHIEEQLRAKRLSARRDADDVKRRIEADKEMFDSFTNYDLIVNDPNF